MRPVAVALLCLAAVACGGKSVMPVLGEFTVRIGSAPELLIDEAGPAPRGNSARHDRLLELFAESGCRDLDERWRSPSALPHVVCTLPGRTASTILVSADFAEPLDRRIPDNWSGAAMLPSLYRSLRVEPREHTYVFVGFADETRRRRGGPTASVRMVESLPSQERRDLVALVALRGLSLDVTSVWKPEADGNLYLDLHSVSRSLDLPVRRLDFNTLPIRDVQQDRRGLVEYAGDGSWAVRPRPEVPSILIGVAHPFGEYLDSFRLVSVYLSYLDQTLAIRKRMIENADTAKQRSIRLPSG